MNEQEMAEEWFDENCMHSYADNEEQLKEDCISAFIAGLHKNDNVIEDLKLQINQAKILLEKILDIYIPPFYRPKEFNLARKEIAKFLEECENQSNS